MCDTLIATREMTVDGYTIFGKNSDRNCNEPQYFVHIPRSEHSANEMVTCTYLTVEQVRHTNALLLSKPSWIWGGEMGINEFGVCIGNEAVYSKETSKEKALLGMDLLRLALERSSTAREALYVITELLEKYGQGGNGGFEAEFYYDNSFMITDANETWYLETAGKYWAAKKLEGVHAISNHMTIGRPDLEHPMARSHAREMAYPVTEPFDFSGSYIDWDRPQNISGFIRRSAGQHMLELPGRQFALKDMIKTLQSHTTDSPWKKGDMSICKHATGYASESSTTNTMIAMINPDNLMMWGTGMSTPCIAPFQPFWFDTYSNHLVFAYHDQEQARQQWLYREKLNRAMLSGRLNEKIYRLELTNMQERWLRESKNVEYYARQEFCDSVAAEAARFIEKWINQSTMTAEKYYDEDFSQYWRVKNASLGKDCRIVY
ncbi:MAG: C69 family dipeptidase [Clostridiales bacterium]|nr:C69 family dipeptidase [Clostridiales bacterium]